MNNIFKKMFDTTAAVDTTAVQTDKDEDNKILNFALPPSHINTHPLAPYAYANSSANWPEFEKESSIEDERYIKLKTELKQEIVQEVFEEIFKQLLDVNIVDQKEMKEKLHVIMERMGYK